MLRQGKIVTQERPVISTSEEPLDSFSIPGKFSISLAPFSINLTVTIRAMIDVLISFNQPFQIVCYFGWSYSGT